VWALAGPLGALSDAPNLAGFMPLFMLGVFFDRIAYVPEQWPSASSASAGAPSRAPTASFHVGLRPAVVRLIHRPAASFHVGLRPAIAQQGRSDSATWSAARATTLLPHPLHWPDHHRSDHHR